MKINVLKASLLAVFCLLSFSSHSQVRISGTIGNVNIRTVSTLKAAFDSINNGNFKGDILIDVIGNTNELATATLVASGVGNANYVSVLIKPVGGSFSINGNLVNLLLFNGAKNVTIDGKMQAGDTLKFSNTQFSAFNFNSGASNNIIKNCIINATSEFAIGINVSSLGAKCSNITVSNCTIGPSTGILKNGILCRPGSTFVNSNLTFYKNRIFDVQLSAISLLYTTRSKIIGNRIYNTKTYLHNSSVSGGYNIKSILISDGGGYIIDSNVIGYENAEGTGTMNILANSINITGFPTAYTPTGTARSMSYTAIECFFSQDSLHSSINGNIISNIAFYTSRNNTSNTKAFYGIRVLKGAVGIGDVVGNVIGSTSERGSIYVATTAINTTACAISLVSENNATVMNNKIGGFDISGTINNSSGSFVGIFVQRINSVYMEPISISNNIIGNELSDNIRVGILKSQTLFSNIGSIFLPSGSLGFVYGIHSYANTKINIGEKNLPNIIRNVNLNVGNVTTNIAIRLNGIFADGEINRVSYNEIYNLKTNGNNFSISSTNVSSAGIIADNVSGSSPEISYNIIHDIYSTYANETIANVGIGVKGSASCIIQNNKIYNLHVSPALNYKSYIIGLYFPNVVNQLSVFNNMITLGIGQNKEINISGIWAGSTPSSNIYNNSIYIGGSSKNYNSFCFQRGYLNANSASFVNIYNNIFINNRVSPDSVDNFAISNNYKTVNVNARLGWGEQFSNNNFLYARNHSKLGYWNGNRNFKAWISASNCDSQSVSTTIPNFVDTLNGDLTIVVDSLSYVLESAGIKLSSNVIDYYGNSRENPINTINNAGFSYDMGAVEFDGKALDLQGPTINYNHAKYQNSTQKLRIDSVYIFDKSGVNNSVGLKPRLYFKKETDPNIFVSNNPTDIGWKFVEATNSSSPYHFNPDFTILNGDTPTNNTAIQYFIIAQDLSSNSNVSLMRARATGTPSSVNLLSANFPILDTLNKVKICKTCKELKGDYLLGGSNNYPGVGTDYSSISDFLNDFEPGIIRRVKILNKGNSYTNAPRIDFIGGGGSGATAVAVLNTDGTIREIRITNPGSGYTSKPTITITRVGTTGAGLALDLDISNGAYFAGETNLLLSSTYNNINEIDIYSGSYTANGIKITSIKAYGISESNKLIIKPAPNTSHVFKNYSTVNPIIMFRQTEHITIDGSNNNSNSRDITFQYRKNASGSILMGYSTIYDRGNKYITIKNCKIIRDTVFNGMNTLIGITMAGTNQTTASLGYNNDFIKIINNEIYGCDVPIYFCASNYRKDQHNLIKGNYLYNGAYPNKVIGINAAYQNNLLIEENYIAGMRSNILNIAISLLELGMDYDLTANSSIGSARISKNIIFNNQSSSSAPTTGIYVPKCPNNTITIDNNLIYYTEYQQQTKSLKGVFIEGDDNSQYNIYHNTIYLDGIKSNNAALTETSYNLAIDKSCKLEIKNNILYNNVATLSNRKAVNIGLGYYNQNNVYKSFISDYNLFYKSDSNCKLVYPYQVNSVGGIFIDSLNEYRALTNQDTHSIFKKIDFNLLDGIPRIDKALVCDFNNLIPILPAYDLDLFNTKRNSLLVDYGAEEYSFSFDVSYKLAIDTCSSTFVDLTNTQNFIGNISNLTVGYYEDSLATLLVNRPDSVTISKKYYIKLSNLNCEEILSVNVSIFSPLVASIKLLNEKSCTTDTSNSILITGVTNGLFSSDTGLFINPITGLINPSKSTVGQHIIQYSYQSTPFCTNAVFDTVEIVEGANAVINSNAGFSFCEGDSIVLTALLQNKYLWSTGDTTQSIVVHVPGLYSLVTSNSLCVDSASVLVQHFPKSTLQISVTNDTLYTDSTFIGYAWFKDSVLIPFANNYFIVPQITGVYEVHAMDKNSCLTKSEEFNYVFNSVKLEGINELKLYPNPASSEVILVGKDFYNSIKIYNTFGMLLKEIKYTNVVNIKIDDLPNGLYLIVADGFSGKFIKN